MPENLAQLRLQCGWSKVQAARSLRLGADVWQKLEHGLILPESLSSTQAERLAKGLGVSADLFLALLARSRPQPVILCQRRASVSAPLEPMAQSFALALGRSAMPAADKRLWTS
jgi:transcriptional regulator with XRE-family HTH domain